MKIDESRKTLKDADRSSNRLNFSIRSESVNEEERSVEVILATESRVLVYDRMNNRPIEEVLLMDGMEQVPHMPLLDDHSRWSIDDVFGSVDNVRVENGNLACRFVFADLRELQDDNEAKRIERAWLKVKQGHQKNVSVGYRVKQSQTIQSGQTAIVMGRSFTAGEYPLRVCTSWKPNEGSLTVIGADGNSHIRKEHETMNKKLISFLQKNGLRSDATISESWEFLSGLEGQVRKDAEQLIDENHDVIPEDFKRSEEANGDQSETNPEPKKPVNQTLRSDSGSQSPDLKNQVQDAIRSERTRVAEIQETFRKAGVNNPELMQRAINEEWTAAQTALELLPMVRSHYQSDNENYSQGPAIHSSRQADINGLSAALMLRSGVALDNPVFESSYSRRSEIPSAFRRSINDPERQKALELGHRYEDLSLVDLCRMALQVTGQTPAIDRTEMIRQAVSSSQVASIFTTNVSAMVLASYVDAEDSTMQWTTSADVGNFQTNERHTMGKTGPLTRHGRGAEADHMDLDSSKEEYKIARYSGQMFMDEMDIIDDRLSALDSTTPDEMGLAARQLRPDLVYAELLANSNLNATSRALFNATDANLFTGGGSALGLAGLSAGVTAIQKQRIKNRPLNLALKFVLVPADLRLTLMQLLRSVEIRESASANGTYNVLGNLGLVGISDDRLGVNGVVHPETGVRYTGTAINWFAAAQPGVSGAKTIEVGYLRGTARAPQINSWVENRGKWGIGFAVKMDIGAKPLDFRAMQKHAGT